MKNKNIIIPFVIMIILSIAFVGCKNIKNTPSNVNSSSSISKISSSPSTSSNSTTKNKIDVKLTNETIISKDEDKGIYNDGIRFYLKITNNTNKNIKGFEGDLTFNDMFGHTIKNITLDETNMINANSSIEDNDKMLKVNPFIDEDVKLKNTKFSDITMLFTLSKIIYSDGTSDN